ncbi:MAG TPA: hypothetical protein VN317_08580, partial [Candidatus Methanoperedens sp.]|nr:hypothetical protein [Candidatus Methanoperedens sp.]
EDGVHSVLMVVVDRDAPRHREGLAAIYADLFGPGKSDPLAPTQFEVIDRATDEAVARLIAAGLVTKATRAVRPLFPAGEALPAAGLTDEEKSRADVHRRQAVRRLKAGNLLGEGGLDTEALAALRDAAHQLACALAVENRVPEPAALAEALALPLTYSLGEAWSSLRPILLEPPREWRELSGGLGGFLG